MISSQQATIAIDLEAVAHNLESARETAPASKVMAVVKANAYGHGAVEVARKLKTADAFAVARVSEAVELREAGIGQPICLLEGVADKEELNLASIYELQCVVHSNHQLELMRRGGAIRPVWIKVDTGMGRLGFAPEDVPAVLENLGHQKLQGLMTHLAEADDRASGKTDLQLERMKTLGESVAHPAARCLSIANSAGLINYPAARAEWVRPGLMLYGASPMKDLEERTELIPAMSFNAPVAAVHAVKAGESVGYGGIWTADHDSRVAVVAVGYADGYPRETAPGTPVLLNGSSRPLVGRVSMDMICVRLEPEDRILPGDRAVLWGEGLPVETIARHACTIPYTLLCGISARVNRSYRGRERHR